MKYPAPPKHIDRATLQIILVVPPGDSHYSVPPLGLGYLAASLRKRGFLNVDIIDARRERLSIADVIQKIAGADIVGFSALSIDVPNLRQILIALSSNSKKPLTLVGGAHVSARLEKSFDDLPGIHAAFIGEAEYTLPDSLDHWLVHGVLPADMPGVATSETTFVSVAERIKDLDALPIPAWDLIPPAAYNQSPQGAFFKALPIAPVLTTRGCPFSCTFCGSHLVMGRMPRTRSISKILEEIEFLRISHGVKEFHILDDAFSLYPERVLEFCEGFKKLGERMWFTFPNGLRLETLTESLATAMKKAGLHSPTVGIESGSQRILNRMQKGLSIELIREKIGMMAMLGLRPNAFFILGFPGETVADIKATINFACELPLRRAHFSNFLPLPGTKITSELENTGKWHWKDFSKLHYAQEPYLPDGFRPGTLKYWQRTAYRRFYLRPSRFLALLHDIQSFEHLKWLLHRMVDYVF